MIQHDPTPDGISKLTITKSSNTGFSVFFIIATFICIFVQFFVVMNVIVGGGYFTSMKLYIIALIMPIFQFFFGIGICSVVIDKFKPDTDNLRKTPPDSGIYRLAQVTIIFVFIYCIANIPFFIKTYPLNK